MSQKLIPRFEHTKWKLSLELLIYNIKLQKDILKLVNYPPLPSAILNWIKFQKSHTYLLLVSYFQWYTYLLDSIFLIFDPTKNSIITKKSSRYNLKQKRHWGLNSGEYRLNFDKIYHRHQKYIIMKIVDRSGPKMVSKIGRFPEERELIEHKEIRSLWLRNCFNVSCIKYLFFCWVHISFSKYFASQSSIEFAK